MLTRTPTSQPIRIPCTFMRGGTSRGPYFRTADLPADQAERDAVLLSAMGSGHDLQVDGLGGGNPLTSKVAIVGPATVPGADVDYLFAQVSVRERIVDTSPNCGNMLAGVGPFAIETGLVPATPGTTTVRIHNVNTRKIIEARVATPDGVVTYDGDARIDGVPGTAAPIYLAFLDAAGAKTGKLFPTGSPVDQIGGIDVTCIDCAMPMVIMRAKDMGKTGYETPEELNADKEFLARLETLRLEAGRRMGLGDVSKLVIPKPVLIAPAREEGGAFTARYFMPHACHKSLAVTGSVGLATACTEPQTIPAQFAGRIALPQTIKIEHPSGHLAVRLDQVDGRPIPVASVVRTARRILEGTLFVPHAVLEAAHKNKT